MPPARVFVCADVGGTFTDCLASWTDAEQRQQSGCIKVLSTGLVRTRVIDVDPAGSLRIIVPRELTGGNQDRLPDGFFCTASVSVLIDGVGHPLGRIIAFDADQSRLTLSNVSATVFDRLRGDGVIEIDCGIEAPVLATRLLLGVPIDQPLPPLEVRLGTTRGTNALLTRTGASTALVATAGFGDVLLIGEQDRPELFDLAVTKPPPLAETVIEIRGRLDSAGSELEPIREDEIREALQTVRRAGVEAIAICLLHAHLNADHELAVERIAQEVGFHNVSRSSEVAPLIKLVARTETTALDAYLNPILRSYIRRVRQHFGGASCDLKLMTSGGNLSKADDFRGRDSVLSGPAGGVVALREIADTHRCRLAIGLDMGGTSTDVSRFDGRIGRRYETRLAGLRVLTPMMDIHTVAAGGGSICDYVDGRLVVGPASAGATPGPACYGRGGPLTVTDVNVMLGRISVPRFPFPLSPQASRERLGHVADRLDQSKIDPLELAEGFLDIAVTHMAEAVRAITTSRGVDVRDHTLVGFGGAAGQHLCRVADALGIGEIIDHPRASVLSAVGIGVAPHGVIETVGMYRRHDELSADAFAAAVGELRRRTQSALQNDPSQQLSIRFECDCRYVGTDASIALPIEGTPGQGYDALRDRFDAEHTRRFGYSRGATAIEVVSMRCEATESASKHRDVLFTASPGAMAPKENKSVDEASAETTQVYHRGQWQSFRVLARDSLISGERIPPASMVISDQSTLIVEPNWNGRVSADGSITLTPTVQSPSDDADTAAENAQPQPTDATAEAVQMEIVARRMQSIADSMGEVLRRTAISVNIKERLDFSCAVFAADGALIANAPHVPVHLGAMGHSVRHIRSTFPDMTEGDCYVTNDPYAGGSHLPDVTVVTPVFCDDAADSDTASFFVASRAHHAEIGGRTPGSMPPMARSLAEEGVLIRDFALVRNGRSNEQQLADILSSGPYPSRNVDENLADLRAQIAAGREGATAVKQMVAEWTLPLVERLATRLMDVAEQSAFRWIATLPETEMRFRDSLDDGTEIAVRLQRDHSRLIVDFDGTASVHPLGFNATPSIVNSAVLYVMKCFCDSNLPLCDGVMRPIDLRIPSGLLSPPADPDPSRCPAVVAGNVETSQRLVDVLLGAIGSDLGGQPVFRSVAASQGTMNNVLMGNQRFGYYETIGGGSGATMFGQGADGVHTHMTNTRITDPEILETRLPIRLREFSIRRGSGGMGKHRGGDGLIREFEFLTDLTVSLITNRRESAPYGAMGGSAGHPGKNLLMRRGQAADVLPSAGTIQVVAGDRLRIETPGGGGWGEPVPGN